MAGEVFTDFTAGELSPRFKGRFDLDLYHKGALEVTNFIPIYPGGVTIRPGFEHKAQIGTAKVRLVPFVISDALSYILEFSALKLRIWKDGELLTSGGSALEFTTRYTDIFALQFAQDAGNLYIASGIDKVKVLTLTDYSTFTFGDLQITGNSGKLPFQEVEGNYPKAIAIHDGRMYLAGTDAEPQTIWASEPYDYGNFTYYDTIESTSTQLREPLHTFKGTINATSELLLARKTIFNVAAADLAVMKIGDTLMGTGIPYEYPDTVTRIAEIGSDRIIMDRAATQSGTYTLYSSWYDREIPEYEDITTSRDVITTANGFKKTIASESNEQILWMASCGNLIVGTTCTERMVPSGADASSFVCKKMTSHGSKRIQPVMLNDVVVFIGPDGRSAREYVMQGLTDNDNSYNAPMLSINADHILTGTVQMEYSSSGTSICWLVQADGSMIGVIRDRFVGTNSFFRITLASGSIESACVIPEEGDDKLYVSVSRAGTRHLEKLGTLYSGKHLDEYAEKIVTNHQISGLSWLSGDATLVYSGKKYAIIVVNGYAVVDSSIPEGATVLVGNDFTARVRTMPEANNPMRKKSIPKATLRVLDSYSFKMGYAGSLQDAPISGPYSGDVDIMIGGGWDTEGVLTIQQDSLPLTVLAVRLDVNQGG